MPVLDPIGELLNRQIPEKLWHYTSVRGFEGIVTSKEIYATDLRFLNDREEFVHARMIANELIEEMPERSSNGFRSRENLRKSVKIAFDTGPLQSGRLQVFVASFSAAADKLSQWRGYSHGSAGVSVAFDLTAMRPPANADELISFAPCIYDSAEKR